MREIRKSGLKRAEEAVSLPLRYSTREPDQPDDLDGRPGLFQDEPDSPW